ncbi:WhiB family transcriptional regulator [Streptosporangium canum]|uniref:WhiB family transcriptional regulator n=1 Tax=Streptosporangium canum TaxID=324952 RepID=UPI0036BCB266
MATNFTGVSTVAVRLHPALLSPSQRRAAFRPENGMPDIECVYDPELHTGPDRAESPEEREARESVARDVCASCPALALCHAYALEVLPSSGVWSGLTPPEIAEHAADLNWLEVA